MSCVEVVDTHGFVQFECFMYCYFQSDSFGTCILRESIAAHFVHILISLHLVENKLIFSINVNEDAVGI